eukprot:4895183-Pyramimonas_sp.AAC.1
MFPIVLFSCSFRLHRRVLTRVGSSYPERVVLVGTWRAKGGCTSIIVESAALSVGAVSELFSCNMLQSPRLVCSATNQPANAKTAAETAGVDVKGNIVDAKGHRVDVKGNSVDVKGKARTRVSPGKGSRKSVAEAQWP